VNINAVWANLIVEECCRLGVTVCIPRTLNWMNTHFWHSLKFVTP
jgi:hypothetical protein